MPLDKYHEKAHRVEVEAARQNASLAVIRNAVAGVPGFAGLLRGQVRRTPKTIYDINGSPLFYDFPVTVRGGDGGFVRTAASRVLGSPVISMELGQRRWNYGAAVKKLLPQVKKGNLKISRPKLVCYSYPKLGVMFETQAKRGQKKRQIFDVASLKPVADLPKRGNREGSFAWSYYDYLDNRKRSGAVRRFAKLDDFRTKQPTILRRRIDRVSELSRVVDFAKLKFRLTRTKTLEFCPHYGTEHARSHHCFVLHGQEVDDYCAVATCQMILCYYRYYYDQDSIAPSLGYSSGSGCPSDQSAGYETLSNNHIIATYDTSATFSEARQQIDQQQPMKSGIPGHARAVAGYSYTIVAMPLSFTTQQLYVYDPWPWDSDYAVGGTLSWEDWSSVSHTNFIYTELDY